MIRPTHYSLLGSHAVRSGWFDAADLLLRLPNESEVLFGLRTYGYVERAGVGDSERWGSWEPLRTTIDLDEARFWDFRKVMWLGPDPWPCLVWSNATGFSERAISTTFAPEMHGHLVAGSDGRGLPRPEDLGVEVIGDLVWQSID